MQHVFAPHRSGFLRNQGSRQGDPRTSRNIGYVFVLVWIAENESDTILDVMEKSASGEAELVSTLTVLKTVFTLPGMSCRPEDSITGAVHMAIFRNGYEFQSRVLRIPDRYGLFWPTLPEVQQEQGAKFALVIFACVVIMVLCTSTGYLLREESTHIGADLVSLGVGYNCSIFALVWVLSLYDNRRKTDQRAGGVVAPEKV